MKYKVFIDGAHGTTGLEIRGRLAARSDIEVLEIEESRRKDLGARVEMAKRADITIMCLPDAASRELAAALPAGVRVIDTSTAHRVDPGWVYGMPGLEPGARERIRAAERVANPGCHATGFILLARPLVDAGVITADQRLCCFCVTGYSGGGRKMIEDYERRHAAVSPAQYALGQSHKHLPEMKLMSGLTKEPVFCPVVGDFYRGMVMTIELPVEQIDPAWLRQDPGKEVDPGAAHKSEVDPGAAHKKENDPVAAQQKEVDPVAAQQKENDPVAAQEKENDPVAAQKKENDPGAAQKKEVDPGAAHNTGAENILSSTIQGISEKDDASTLHTVQSLRERIENIYRERYGKEVLIAVKDGPENGFLYSDAMAMSDGLEIMVLGNEERILLVSRFDNLGKGASGAAVQNLNIMLGTDEHLGLRMQAD